MSRCPSLVRADLQRYYGLNIERMGVEFSAFHAAECLSCLPAGSLTLAELDKRLTYGNVEYMLHAIMTGMAGKEIPFPWEKAKSGIDGVETESLPLDEFKDWYENTSWREVDNWQVL